MRAKAMKLCLLRFACMGLLAVLFTLTRYGTAEAASVHVTGAVTNQSGQGIQNVSVTATGPGGCGVPKVGLCR